MADVFISYSTADRSIAESLAGVLKLRGFDVWWDAELYAGQNFHSAIRDAIGAAKAVVVIWSRTSVDSNWVLGEASEAGQKLVCTRLDSLPLRSLPIPYLPLHCVLATNHDAVATAVGNTIAGKARSSRFDELEAIRARADLGDIDAIIVYGRMLEDGQGVEENHREAFGYYRLAAKGGDAVAQLLLGRMYERGLGVTKDETEALRLYKLAGNQGLATAQFNAGVMHQYGRGTPVDLTLAAYWYSLASEKGDVEAATNLGILYENGTGVPLSYAKAFELYRMAAEKDHAPAIYCLALMYGKGHGVRQSDDAAVELMRASARLGFEAAKMVVRSRGIAE